MKKMLISTLVLILLAGSAAAVIDPDPDSMGLYFDLEADVYESQATIYDDIMVHVILTNPSFENLRGYEFGLTVSTPNLIILAANLHGPGPLDVGLTLGNHIVGLASPYPTTEATLLVSFHLFPLVPEAIHLTLHNAEPSSYPGGLLPVVLLEDYSLMQTGTSSFYDSLPQVNAILNGTGVVATENRTLDQVKSLYR